MSYSPEHKKQMRAKIVEAARVLFNRHGFENVTIDMVMELAGLTRGGFYSYFNNKDQLYSEAITSFISGKGAELRAAAGIDPRNPTPDLARQMVSCYLSAKHLDILDDQCPMIALSTDVARASTEVQSAYQTLLEAMVALFQRSLEKHTDNARNQALSLSALCVGGMVLARTLPDSPLAQEIQAAAIATADEIIQPPS